MTLSAAQLLSTILAAEKRGYFTMREQWTLTLQARESLAREAGK